MDPWYWLVTIHVCICMVGPCLPWGRTSTTCGKTSGEIWLQMRRYYYVSYKKKSEHKGLIVYASHVKLLLPPAAGLTSLIARLHTGPTSRVKMVSWASVTTRQGFVSLWHCGMAKIPSWRRGFLDSLDRRFVWPFMHQILHVAWWPLLGLLLTHWPLGNVTVSLNY